VVTAIVQQVVTADQKGHVHGKLAWYVRARGRGCFEQPVVVAQDRQMESTQRRCGVQTVFVAQPSAQSLISIESVRAPAQTVQSEQPGTGQLFPGRMMVDQFGQLVDQSRVVAEGKLCRDSLLERRPALFFQTGGQSPQAQPVERRASPEC
jgi:hypothetical protein